MLSNHYLFTKIRTNRNYIYFLVVQLLFSFGVAITGLMSSEHFRNPYTIALEIIIALCIAFDLVVRANSESGFCKSKGNILDLVTYFCFIGLIIYMSMSSKESENVIVQTDDLVVICIIIFRYLVQILRLGFLIKNSADSIQMQKELKEVDLNQPPVWTSKTGTHTEQDHGSQVFRNKMMDYVLGYRPEPEPKLEEPSIVVTPLNEDA